MSIMIPQGMEYLRAFSGSDSFYRHALNRNTLMTEGVAHCADNGFGWLTDKIATLQAIPKVKAEPFQVWHLRRVCANNNRAKLVCEDGNNKVVYAEVIDYTDCEEPGITFWFSDGVMMLPSEY